MLRYELVGDSLLLEVDQRIIIGKHQAGDDPRYLLHAGTQWEDDDGNTHSGPPFRIFGEIQNAWERGILKGKLVGVLRLGIDEAAELHCWGMDDEENGPRTREAFQRYRTLGPAPEDAEVYLAAWASVRDDPRPLLLWAEVLWACFGPIGEVASTAISAGLGRPVITEGDFEDVFEIIHSAHLDAEGFPEGSILQPD